MDHQLTCLCSALFYSRLHVATKSTFEKKQSRIHIILKPKLYITLFECIPCQLSFLDNLYYYYALIIIMHHHWQGRREKG